MIPQQPPPFDPGLPSSMALFVAVAAVAIAGYIAATLIWELIGAAQGLANENDQLMAENTLLRRVMSAPAEGAAGSE